MTLLSLVQNVADEVGAQRPTAVYNSSDQTAKRLFQACKKECEFLVRRYAWSALRREATISTVASTGDYALESDFHRMLDETVWDATEYWPMHGSLTPQQWQNVKRSTIARPVNRRRFRLMWDGTTKTRRIFIDPVPTSVATLYYEYVSNQFCQATGGGALRSAWAADTDVATLDENLIELGVKYRYLQARGLPYADQESDYRKALIRAIGNDRPVQGVDLGAQPSAMFQLPEGNFTL
jgi:hypothetical protein